MTTLVLAARGPLATAADAARDYIRAAKAKNTRRAYRSDWRDFEKWAAQAGVTALPAAPATVGLYLATRAATLRPATLARRLVALTLAHRAAGHALDTRAPEIHETMAGIRRTHGTAQRGKAPILTADLRRLVTALPDTPVGRRDRALLLLGFAGAFRRSELVGLDRDDLEFTADGLVVTLRRSKTDQDGQGRMIGVPYGGTPATCPVRALEAWIAAGDIGSGPVFRGARGRSGRIGARRLCDRSVALIVKRAAKRADLDPQRFAGHSLRAGLATSAAQGGASERAIMAQTGHRSTAMVRRYIRQGSLFEENAAARVGL